MFNERINVTAARMDVIITHNPRKPKYRSIIFHHHLLMKWLFYYHFGQNRFLKISITVESEVFLALILEFR